MTATPIKKISAKKSQWLWFVGLWLAGFCTLALISLVIRAIMNIG